MVTINIHEAKTQFSRLVERVRAGEKIIIARAGKPGARRVWQNQRSHSYGHEWQRA